MIVRSRVLVRDLRWRDRVGASAQHVVSAWLHRGGSRRIGRKSEGHM